MMKWGELYKIILTVFWPMFGHSRFFLFLNFENFKMLRFRRIDVVLFSLQVLNKLSLFCQIFVTRCRFSGTIINFVYLTIPRLNFVYFKGSSLLHFQ